MKYSYPLALTLSLAAATATYAQSVGIGTPTPNAAAALDVTASGRGLLIPRMDSAARDAIAAPVPAGLLVYQTGPRAGFYYYAAGTGWVFLPNKGRAGDNLGNHSATQSLVLNGNPLRLRGSADANHALRYDGTYDGPLLFGYGGGALGYTTNGTTITPALRWTGGNNVAIGLAGTNAGNGPDLSFGGAGYGEGIGSARTGSSNLFGLDFYTSGVKRLSIGYGGTVSVGVAGTNTGTAPDLVLGGSGTGEGIGSARSMGNPNQYGIDFYTASTKRVSLTNTGSVGIGTDAPNSTLQVAGSLAVGVVRGLAGGAGTPGTALANAGYYGLNPTSGGAYYQLPDPATCEGRVYYLRNNASNGSTGVILTTGGGSFYDGTSSSAGSTYGLSATGSSKTVTAISDGLNWTIIKSGN